MAEQSRETQLTGTLQMVVNIITSTENNAEIRQIIGDAGVEPGIHVGDPPESFEGDRVKTTEYVLGQWASMIDSDSPFLNSARNITLAWIEEGKTLPVAIRPGWGSGDLEV